jgi:hypothetical protein
MKVKTIATVSTLILAFASISSAQAGDITNYPASSCTVDNGRWFSQDYTFNATNRSLVNESPTKSLVVNCPFVRDGNRKYTNAWVRVLDKNPEKNARCTFLRFSTNGRFRNGHRRFSDNSTEALQKIEFLLGNLSAPPEDFMHIQCLIPPASGEYKSAILSYSADESSDES